MRWLRWLALTVLALVFVAIASYWWIIATPGGASFILGRAATMMGKGARIEGVGGRLGGELRVKLVVIDRPDLYVRVDDVDMDTSSNFAGGLTVHRLFARNIEVRTRSTGAAASLPASLKPPYDVRLEDGGVGTFTMGAIGSHDKDVVLRDIVLKGEGDRRRWKIDKAAVTTQYGNARLAGTLGNSPPFEVELDAGFDGQLQDRPAKVEAKLSGTLKALAANAEALVAGTRASAQAQIAPFESPPIKSLSLDAKEVDLHAVDASLPHTRASLEARLAPRGDGIAGHVLVRNAEPGPIDAGHFPIASAQANVEASTARIDLSAIEIALAGGGSAHGTAHVKDGAAQARLQLEGVDLAALHGGLQKTRIAGSVALAGTKGAQQFEVALQDPRFSLKGNAGLADGRLDVKSAEVRAGGGVLSTSGSLALKGRKEFRFEGRAQHFDPSAFAKTQRGDLSFTFTASGTMAEPVGGEARVEIASSTFAGLPASGHAAVAGDRQRIARRRRGSRARRHACDREGQLRRAGRRDGCDGEGRELFGAREAAGSHARRPARRDGPPHRHVPFDRGKRGGQRSQPRAALEPLRARVHAAGDRGHRAAKPDRCEPASARWRSARKSRPLRSRSRSRPRSRERVPRIASTARSG